MQFVVAVIGAVGCGSVSGCCVDGFVLVVKAIMADAQWAATIVDRK